jgi:predicted PurR-regulated permease PerM
MPHPHWDLTSTTLSVLFIGGLILASFLVMQPFLPAILWAVTLVVATWPLMLRVQHCVGDRRGIAVLIMTLVLLLVLVVPLWLAVSTIVDNLDDIAELIQRILALRVLEPPAWVADLPLVGRQVARAWHQVTDAGVVELGPRLTPYAGALTRWFASTVGNLAGTFVQFLLTVGIAAALYALGESGVAAAVRFGRRLGGDRGEMAIHLAGQAIRSVALGVVVTAVAQSVMGGIGLAIVGLPFAPVLTAVMFVLCLAQLGPALVLIPAVIWMYYAGDPLWGTVLLAFSIVAMTMDNFLRPILIRRGAPLPLALILAGVIGGMIAMGLLGIFLGPTVLGIAYTLLNAWIAEGDEADPPAAPVP